MRGTNHLLVTTIIASTACAYLLHPNTLIDVMLCMVGMIAVLYGSIAPDIDLKRSLIRRWYMIIPCLPLLGVHWLLGIVYGFKHRGVMHSLIGWSISFAVFGVITDIAFGRTISMAVCGGFAFGYLAHLIEDELTTKTRIEWLPAPQRMTTWKFGIVSVLILLCVVSFASAAGEPDPPMPEPGDQDNRIDEKSFEDMIKDVDKFLATVFWFSVKVAISFAGLMAIANKAHKSISITQGIILAFLIVFVLFGVLKTLFT